MALAATRGEGEPFVIFNASVAQLVEPVAHNGLVAGSNPAAGTTF